MRELRRHGRPAPAVRRRPASEPGPLKAPRLFVLLGLILAAASCVSSRDRGPEPRNLDEMTYQEIDGLIRKDSPAKALQWISGLRQKRSPLLPEGDLADLEARAGDKLKELYAQSLEEKKYDLALSHLVSLRNLKLLPDSPQWDRNRLLFRQAEEYRSSGNGVLALYTFLKMDDFSALDGEDLLAYADISAELNNPGSLRTLLGIMAEKGLTFPEEKARALNRPFSPTDMMDGAATIWVNRGIRIERGVGLPDRVIGSGFFIDPRGYLLTNYHVIASEVDPTYEGYSRLYIRPSGRTEDRIPAKVVGFDKIFDVALLKVDLKPEFVFGVTDVQELRAGSRIFAIGSPGGLENTITSGIISATGRRFLQMGDAMQMDVPVNPGSSGGPLVDESGRLVGIVFAGIEQFEGVNFAIPGYWLRKFLPKLYTEGEVTHSWIGLSVHESRKQLEVLYTVPRSPGQEAGIVPGDIIVRVNGSPVDSIRAAQDILLSLEPETLVPLTYSRGGEESTVFIALGKRPFSPLEKPLEFEAREKLFAPLFGFTARHVSSGLFSSEYSVNRVIPGSVADETGISENDPFSLRQWVVDKEHRVVLVQIVIKKRKAGFLEGGVQFGSYFEQNNFI